MRRTVFGLFLRQGQHVPGGASGGFLGFQDRTKSGARPQKGDPEKAWEVGFGGLRWDAVGCGGLGGSLEDDATRRRLSSFQAERLVPTCSPLQPISHLQTIPALL